ncbi:MAG: GNAT family N-acetyltransferase [Eubacteriales bacterium]|nr:GNAT family N-acetyltransferase [Eubacteriales bacterium]
MQPIQTARCLIRPFTEADLDDFIVYRNNGRWMRFQGFKGLSRQAYRDALLAPIDERAGHQLAVTLTDSGQLVGDLYFQREGDECHIGYTVAPPFAGQGYATEAAAGLLNWAWQNGCLRALASVMPGNAPSLRVLAKLGFCPKDYDAEGDLLFTLLLRETPKPENPY